MHVETGSERILMSGAILQAGFALKDRVWIDGEGSIEGWVTAIQFRSDREPVLEVSYLHNGDSKVAWFEQWRLTKAGEK